MAASGSQVGSGDRPVPVEEIFRLLESTDLTIVDDIHQLILENLSQGKELWLINTLVDYFFSTRSLKAQALLAEVREPLDKVLIDKIHDGLRSADTRLQATQLLLFLVNQQPPWTHSIVTRSVFTTLLKILKSETDVPILMTSILVLVILLPVVPVSIEPHLAEVMEAFARVGGLLVKKPANCPDIFILHLHVAVYAFFLRLYGMFPCTLVSFLRINYAKKENLHAYNEVIVPMLERLRFHPNLITGSKDTETSKTRWQRLEPQDVVVSCAKMCLDVIEGASEELRCPLISSVVPRPPKFQELSGRRDVQEKSWQEKLDAVNHMFPVVEDPTAMVFSPSQLIGLSTPPTSERATPAVVSDQGAPVPGQTSVVLGPHHIAVPTPELPSADPSALTEEPDKGLAGHNTKSASVYRSGLKDTPGCSAFVSPFTVRAPPPSQAPSVEPSPMRLQAETVESSTFQFCEYAASRVLQFDRSPESKGAERLKHTELGDLTASQDAGRLGELREDAELAPVVAGAVAEDTILAVVQTSQESVDPLDQEVSHFTEVDKQFDGSTSVDSSTDDTSQVDPQQHLTAQSIIQFMKKVNRIRFNSMSTQAGEPLMGPREKHPRPCRARSCPTLPHQELTVPCRSSSSSSDAGSIEASTTVETLLEISVPGNDREVQFGETAGLELPLQTPSHASSRQSRNGNDGSLPSLNSSNWHQARSSMGVPPAIKEFAAFFQTLLAPVKVAVCEQCYQVFLEAGVSGETGQHLCDGKRQSLGTWMRCFCSETSVFSSLSPPELLDRHLSRSSDLHAKELARIPLTSWDNVSWTHFGGVPPADEINILRGQILLLHNQLMYERHKRNNHAMRNRRLLRRIAHATTLEEQVQSLTSQLQNSEKHIHNLQVSLKLLQDKNHQLEQKQESDEYEKLFAFRTTLQQNKDLTEGNLELKNLLLVQKAENDELKKELQQVRAGMFQLEKSNEILQKKLQEAHKWREQVLQLQKEVLLMGEAQEHLQERLQQHRAHQSSTSHQTYLVQALQAEIEDLRKQLRQAIPMVEALQVKVTAMEDIIKSKDIAIAEMKNTFQNTKIMYTNEIQAVNDKYQAMLHINTQLEAQLLQQYADNDRLKYRLKELDLNPKGVQRRDVKSPNAGKETAELWDRTKMQGQLSKQPSTEDAKSHKDQKGSPSAQETSSFSLMLSLENSGSAPRRQTAERPASCDSSPHALTVQENESCGIEQLATVHSSHQTPCASHEASVSSSVGMTGKTEAEELKEKLSVQADANLSSGGLSAFSSSGMFLAEPEDRRSFSTHSDITSDSGIFSKGDPVT